MRMFLVNSDAYVIAEDRLDALNTYLGEVDESKSLSILLPPYEVSKPLYGSKLLTFNCEDEGCGEFMETSVSGWIGMCEGKSKVMGYVNN